MGECYKRLCNYTKLMTRFMRRSMPPYEPDHPTMRDSYAITSTSGEWRASLVDTRILPSR